MNIGSSDGWDFLRQYTGAQIALGRAGVSLKTKYVLDFQLAHAKAKDAVNEELDLQKLDDALSALFIRIGKIQSRVKSKIEYLHRPDYGRRLSENSVHEWTLLNDGKKFDIQIIVADGLSATAIDVNAFSFLEIFLSKLPNHFTLAPLAIIKYGRVAISDEIGQMSKSTLSIILIGERPGLSSPDSMGIYLTYNPKIGNTDESRNCISNIRPQGLSYELAADKLIFLATEAIRLKISGVHLKDNQKLIF